MIGERGVSFFQCFLDFHRRLDGIHRNHLIERYFPQASHQVILLSTDQEIDEAAWQKLRKHVGHTYQLTHDTASGATTAQTGYLW